MKERITWEEMVKRYPDQWVVLEDAEMDGSTILSGIVVNVCTDDEIDSYFLETFKEGKRYIKERTTDMRGMNIVYAENFRYEIK